MELHIMSADNEVAVLTDSGLTIIDPALCPMFIKRTNDVHTWISSRAIEGVRSNSRILKKVHGLSRFASDYDTAMAYNAACVTDNFWVRTGSETWDDIRFTDDIYFRMALDSDNEMIGRAPSRTPELTNIGTQEKGWRLIGDEWWLYKREPDFQQKAEILTYRVGRLLGFDMAHYEMDGDYIRTLDFTKGEYNLQHADAVMHGKLEDDYEYNYDKLMAMDPALASQYLDIIYLDSLMNNVDRHLKNYGFLTSQEDGSIFRMAPNYDNNMSLYGYPGCLNSDRRGGLMKFFTDFLTSKGIKHEAPELSKNDLLDLCKGFDRPEELVRYIMAGQEVVQQCCV